MHLYPSLGRAVFVLLGLSGILTGCKKDSVAEKTDPSYYDRQAFVLPINSNFLIYDSVAKLTGLIDTLEQPGPYTSFVPTNNAFEVAGWGYVGSNGSVSGLQTPPNIGNILASLIFRGAHRLDSLMPVGANQVWMPMTGVPAYVSKYLYQGDTLYSLNGQEVTQLNFSTSNGPMQVLGNGMPNIQAYPTIGEYIHAGQQFTFLAVALQRTGLDKLLSDTTASWTFLAPDNGAFQNSSDPSLSSLDSLLTADTAKLANLLRLHLLHGRNFLFDFDVQAGAVANAGTGSTDSIRLYAFNGLGVDYINNSGQAYFCAAGDSAQNYDWNTGTYVWGPSPVSLGSSQNQLAGNGVVQELTSFLMP